MRVPRTTWRELARFRRCARGASLVEYALVLFLILVAAATATKVLGKRTATVYDTIPKLYF